MPPTPGPWTYAYEGSGSHNVYDIANDMLVAECGCDYGRDESGDNARLIAQAPEMYGLLKKIEFVEDGVTTWCPYCGENPPEHSKGCRLSAVLKAVEGE